MEERMLRMLSLLLLLALFTIALGLNGIDVTRVRDHARVDFKEELFLHNSIEENSRSLIVFGTYAADFNNIEYAQKVAYYLPRLKEKGLKRVFFIMNAEVESCLYLASKTGLPEEVFLYSDPKGLLGKSFGVNRGWKPDDSTLNPYVKLFGMLFGLGAMQTLPSVISGYIGNPWKADPWIENALAIGQVQKRWPSNALELNDEGTVKVNKFNELPYIGEWKRKPLELATLRLQNMVGLSLVDWEKLKPSDDCIKEHGVLTQLGGVRVVDNNLNVLYEFKDEGICHTADFEQIIEKIIVKNVT
jgi:hypothetical protein